MRGTVVNTPGYYYAISYWLSALVMILVHGCGKKDVWKYVYGVLSFISIFTVMFFTDGIKQMFFMPLMVCVFLLMLLYIRMAGELPWRETGFFCADELLYPENHRYLSDLLLYVAIGARSVENQGHRLTASGLDVAVGMKNPTSGDFSVMMNSITAAQSSHMFIYRNWEVVSKGNPYAHAILRGYMNKKGQSLPNYHYEDLKLVCDMYHKAELQNPAIIVDVNHANSGKKFLEQIRISKEVLQSRTFSEDVHDMVKGLMIESYLEDGSQPVNGTVYGQSITDPCLGWDKTERLIHELAEMV